MVEFTDYEHLDWIYLHIGDGGIFDGSCMVQTVLGSCVSVMLICPKHEISGTFHAMLADNRLHEKRDRNYSVYKYVNSAIGCLLEQFAEKDISPRQLRAKVFGGADQIGMRSIGTGESNVQMAYRCLQEKRISILAQDVGGNQGRKLIFNPKSGEVWLRRLANSFYS